jgi:hypothetical protein
MLIQVQGVTAYHLSGDDRVCETHLHPVSERTFADLPTMF